MTVGIRFAYDERVITFLRDKLPKDQRTWDSHLRQWRLSEDAYYEFTQQFPSTKHIKNLIEETSINEYKCEYVSRPKYHIPTKRVVAFGWDSGIIKIAISIEALQSFFKEGTLYNILQINMDASAQDIKDAYRRLARQWHPDVCHEDNAKNQFIKIKRAYDVLTNKRKKYDMGLKMFEIKGKATIEPNMIIPLRCGIITGEIDTNVKPTITRINIWKDIVNDQGQTMTSNWKGDTYVTNWIDKARF